MSVHVCTVIAAARCKSLPVREATEAEITSCHTPGLIQRIRATTAAAQQRLAAGQPGAAQLNGDTYINPHSYACARLAAGGCADVAVAVVRYVDPTPLSAMEAG